MNSSQLRYQELKKPKWAPPAKVFPIVWTFLYILIAVSYGTVFYNIYQGSIPGAVAVPLGLNLVFNLLYTPIQFRLRNNYLALLDVVLVLITLKLSIFAIYQYVPWAAMILLPYFAWVGFATVLQGSVTWLNR